MNKKGIWRIVEAVVAVLLVAGALLFFVSKQSVNVSEKDVSELLRESLEEIAKNQGFREDIINYDSSDVAAADLLKNNQDSKLKTFLHKRIKGNYDFKIDICELNADGSVKDGITCFGVPNVQGELFSAERLISATVDNYAPKAVRIYAWEI